MTSDYEFWTKERIAAWAKLMPEEKRGKARARQQKRRKRIATQRCNCCTLRQINAFIKLAHTLGLQVDHKTALCNGGLHCLKNLEALTPAKHRAKTGPLKGFLPYKRK